MTPAAKPDYAAIAERLRERMCAWCGDCEGCQPLEEAALALQQYERQREELRRFCEAVKWGRAEEAMIPCVTGFDGGYNAALRQLRALLDKFDTPAKGER